MAQDKGKDFPKMALEKLVEARRKAVESIAEGQGQLERELRLLIDAQAGIDVLNKAKSAISKSFKNKVTKVVAPKEPQQQWTTNLEDNGN
jgi:hypothetical protein